jgi:hypothetical protein
MHIETLIAFVGEMSASKLEQVKAIWYETLKAGLYKMNSLIVPQRYYGRIFNY